MTPLEALEKIGFALENAKTTIALYRSDLIAVNEALALIPLIREALNTTTGGNMNKQQIIEEMAEAIRQCDNFKPHALATAAYAIAEKHFMGDVKKVGGGLVNRTHLKDDNLASPTTAHALTPQQQACREIERAIVAAIPSDYPTTAQSDEEIEKLAEQVSEAKTYLATPQRSALEAACLNAKEWFKHGYKLACRHKDAQHQLTIADYEAVLADKRRLTRELDIAMHGEEGAAQQASLCDLITPARKMREQIQQHQQKVRIFETMLDNQLIALGSDAWSHGLKYAIEKIAAEFRRTFGEGV